MPGWAFFHRETVSEDDQCAQEEAERTAAELFEALIADADEVTISEEDGVQSFSATFDLTKWSPDAEKKE